MEATQRAELNFRDLDFRYGDGIEAPLVINSLSGQVSPGELVSIIGPNGAGKSTLLRLLDGLEQPASGEISIGGKLLPDLDHRTRAKTLAFVPQFLDRVPEVNVTNFVLGGRYAHRSGWGHGPADHEAIERALASCDAKDLGSRLLSSLSGGQRQRVLVARAIAQEAPVLLVDEPTNNLDPYHQLAVFELLASLADLGHTVLVVTHDLNLASQFSSRIALMDSGRFITVESPSEVLRPEILKPVYGSGLVFGERPNQSHTPSPFVLSWREPKS